MVDSDVRSDIPNDVVYCTSLKSVTIGNGVESIGNYAFYGCSSLTSITFEGESKLTSIGDSAFRDCSSLTSITILSSVTIGNYAFYGCRKLVEVYNLSSMTITKGSSSNGYVAYYALDVYISATDASKLATTPEGYIFYEDGDTVYLLGYKGSETELTLPDKFNGKNYAIYKCAFYNCTSLKSVTIGNGVTSIGSEAFSGCSSLTSITFEGESKLTSIGSEAFRGCSSLTSITFEGESKLTSIGNYAFYGCSSLTSITIPSSVTSIVSSAFRGCSSLTSITFADTTTWYRTSSYSDWANKTNGTQIGVTNASTNATYFRSTYDDYYWYKL